jgi:DNA polymerase (family X)
MPKDGNRYTRQEAEVVLQKIYFLLGDNFYEVCGSYRRNSPDVGDLDILVVKKPNQKLNLDGFSIDWKGEDKIGFQINSIHVDIKFVPEESWGAGLLHHTGAWGFNIMLRSIAKRKNMILNEYGLFTRDDRKVIAQKTEREILFNLLKPEKAIECLIPANRKTPEWMKK